jgi:hypothetical protein
MLLIIHYSAHGPAYFAYCTNYLIDLDAGIIVDVDASAVSSTAEARATRIMIDRVEAKYDIKPKRLVDDTNYGTAPMLGWMVNDKGIAPHVTVWEKAERDDGSLSRSDFLWDEAADEYRCPEGKPLKRNWRRFKTLRSIHEPAHDVARAIGKTDEYKQSRRERKKVEMLFARLKRILKLDKLRLRGFSGAQDEFLLAATAQNLRRMAMWLTPIVPDIQVITA